MKALVKVFGILSLALCFSAPSYSCGADCKSSCSKSTAQQGDQAKNENCKSCGCKSDDKTTN